MGVKELSNGVWDLLQGFHTRVIKCVFFKPLTLGHPVNQLFGKRKKFQGL